MNLAFLCTFHSIHLQKNNFNLQVYYGNWVEYMDAMSVFVPYKMKYLIF